MKLIAVSDKIVKKIKTDYSRSTLYEFGDVDVTNNQLINELNNISLSSEIYNFTSNHLEDKNFIVKQHHNRIYDLNRKYLKINKKKDLNVIEKKLQNNPYQLNFENDFTLNINEIKEYYKNDYKEEFFNELFNYTYNGIGKGELFLGLLTQLKQSKHNVGDLIYKGNYIEIKSDYARFKHVNGYGSTREAWKYFQIFLESKILSQSYLKTFKLNNPNNWNFNKTNINWIITQLRNLVQENIIDITQLKNLFQNIFKIIYTDITSQLLELYTTILIECIEENKGIKFLEIFLIMQYDYYKYLTEFDYMILINSQKYLIIQSIKDFQKKIKYINYSSFSWKEDRNCVFSVSLKK
jgi:hypothetical protein